MGVATLTRSSVLRLETLLSFFSFPLENGGFAVRGAVVAETLGKFAETIRFPALGSCATLGNLDSPAKNRETGLDTPTADSCPLCR